MVEYSKSVMQTTRREVRHRAHDQELTPQEVGKQRKQANHSPASFQSWSSSNHGWQMMQRSKKAIERAHNKRQTKEYHGFCLFRHFSISLTLPDFSCMLDLPKPKPRLKSSIQEKYTTGNTTVKSVETLKPCALWRFQAIPNKIMKYEDQEPERMPRR